jgi:hypothetical protein
MTLYLIVLSRGESVVKLGEWFTSKMYGFNLLSKITSRPKTSKHIELVQSSG